jgi:hypothetical protein
MHIIGLIAENFQVLTHDVTVWESIEAASELRSVRDASGAATAARDGRDRKFEDAEEDAADSGFFQVMGARRDHSEFSETKCTSRLVVLHHKKIGLCIFSCQNVES